MSFDPTLPTTLDRIRLIVGDTSNDETVEVFPDSVYLAEIDNYTNWKLAAAAMAEAVAVRIEQDPNSVSFPSDMSVGWADRTRQLRATAVRLRQEAAAEDAAGANGVRSVQLQRSGLERSSEYRADYRRLRR